MRQQAKQAASAPVPLLPEHRHSPLHGLVVLTARASALFPGKKRKKLRRKKKKTRDDEVHMDFVLVEVRSHQGGVS